MITDAMVETACRTYKGYDVWQAMLQNENIAFMVDKHRAMMRKVLEAVERDGWEPDTVRGPDVRIVGPHGDKLTITHASGDLVEALVGLCWRLRGSGFTCLSTTTSRRKSPTLEDDS